MAFSKPDIQISDKLPPQRVGAAKALIGKLTPMVDELHRLGAWPKRCGPYSIVIVDEQTTCGLLASNENDDPTTGMATRWHRDRAAPLDQIRRRKADSMAISVSVDFLTVGGASQLAGLGAVEEEIIFHSLAHEIHHLDEAERLSKCGLETPALRVKLALAVRPELPADCQAAVKRFSELHNDKALGTDSILTKAGDIADECCADLTGLHWLGLANLPAPNNWPNFANALANFRLIDFQQDKRNYDIAAELNAALGLPVFPSLSDIHALTFEWAINVAKASPKLDKGVLGMFDNLTLPPTMAAPAPEPASRGNLWGRFFGKQ